MKIKLHNKIIQIRNEIYHLAKESKCICDDCKETLLTNYDKLIEILQDDLKWNIPHIHF